MSMDQSRQEHTQNFHFPFVFPLAFAFSLSVRCSVCLSVCVGVYAVNYGVCLLYRVANCAVAMCEKKCKWSMDRALPIYLQVSNFRLFKLAPINYKI